ncbi:hypothetical protein [Marinicella rhabdoformis]|uniref:hypothetical protein n=1 Tax=Marinicella rhabdoformis TaxID=2580566 RepID=UPI0012AEBC1F|nr:hypothetical protein [Marinicella rhabdoformis]
MNKQNESIPQDLKQQLKQDALWFQQQSELPDKQADLLANIESQLHTTTMVEPNHKSTSRTKWLLPLAAAVSLALWLGNNNVTPHSVETANKGRLKLAAKFKALPTALETKTHNAYQAEQEAIIVDIKSLKDRWLNI